MLSERLLRLRTIWAFQQGEKGKEQNKTKVDSVKWELIIFEDEKRKTSTPEVLYVHQGHPAILGNVSQT